MKPDAFSQEHKPKSCTKERTMDPWNICSLCWHIPSLFGCHCIPAKTCFEVDLGYNFPSWWLNFTTNMLNQKLLLLTYGKYVGEHHRYFQCFLSDYASFHSQTNTLICLLPSFDGHNISLSLSSALKLRVLQKCSLE